MRNKKPPDVSFRDSNDTDSVVAKGREADRSSLVELGVSCNAYAQELVDLVDRGPETSTVNIDAPVRPVAGVYVDTLDRRRVKESSYCSLIIVLFVEIKEIVGNPNSILIHDANYGILKAVFSAAGNRRR